MTKRIAIFAIAFLLAMFGFIAPTYAWGDKTACPGADNNPEYLQTNRFDAFSGHHMDVLVGMCDGPNGSNDHQWLNWTRTPSITFPCRANPNCATEKLSMVDTPFVVDTAKCQIPDTRTCMVKYKWEVQQCFMAKPLCQNFDFTLKYNLLGNTICFVGGKCDDLQTWK